MAKRERQKLAITGLEEVAAAEGAAPQPEPEPGPGVMAARAYNMDPHPLAELCRIIDGKFVLRSPGILNLARRSGSIGLVEVRVVYDADKFALDFGQYILNHAPKTDSGPVGAVNGAYAITVLSDGYRVIEFRRASDLLKDIAEEDPRAKACGTVEDLLKREIMILLFKSVPYDLPWLWRGLEAERQSINGEPVTALPPPRPVPPRK